MRSEIWGDKGSLQRKLTSRVLNAGTCCTVRVLIPVTAPCCKATRIKGNVASEEGPRLFTVKVVSGVSCGCSSKFPCEHNWFFFVDSLCTLKCIINIEFEILQWLLFVMQGCGYISAGGTNIGPAPFSAKRKRRLAINRIGIIQRHIPLPYYK